MATDLSLKRGFNTEEAAHYIGRSVSWLQKKRLHGVDDPGDLGPMFRKSASGYATYLREDLDSWLELLSRGNSSATERGGERDAGSSGAQRDLSTPKTGRRPAATTPRRAPIAATSEGPRT